MLQSPGTSLWGRGAPRWSQKRNFDRRERSWGGVHGNTCPKVWHTSRAGARATEQDISGETQSLMWSRCWTRTSTPPQSKLVCRVPTESAASSRLANEKPSKRRAWPLDGSDTARAHAHTPSTGLGEQVRPWGHTGQGAAPLLPQAGQEGIGQAEPSSWDRAHWAPVPSTEDRCPGPTPPRPSKTWPGGVGLAGRKLLLGSLLSPLPGPGAAWPALTPPGSAQGSPRPGSQVCCGWTLRQWRLQPCHQAAGPGCLGRSAVPHSQAMGASSGLGWPGVR